jgi:GT2 family glycosyltransferase
MNAERVLYGCTVYPDSSTICGIPHRLVKSSNGESFWCDKLFLEFIELYYSRDREIIIGGTFGLPGEMINKGFEAVGELFFSKTQRRYFSSGARKYDNVGYNPLISIVIVNWNGGEHLKDLIESIHAQSYDRYEIIVVDSGSTDCSKKILKSLDGVILIEQTRNIGFCVGNNLGIDMAKGEIIFLLNNDTVLDNYCLEEAVRCVAESPEDTIGIFPKMLFYRMPRIINCIKTQWHCVNMWRDNSVGLLDFPERQKREQVFGGIFAGIFLWRDKFKKLGRFDEKFFTYGEDFDVCYRANLAGYKFYTEPKSIVYHKYRTSSREDTEVYFTLYYFLRNYLLVVLKNYELGNIISAIARFRREFWKPWASRARMNRETKLKRLLRRVTISLLRLAPHILYERMKIRGIRKVADRDLWVFENLDRYNIFHYEGKPVLNLINLRTSFCGNAEYIIDGKRYVVFGKSAYVSEGGQGCKIS